MKRTVQKQKIGLVARLIGGIAFVAVFALNAALFLKADGKGLSLSILTAHAGSGECFWRCPVSNCMNGPSTTPGDCSSHNETLVGEDCGPDEEEENPTGFDKEVITAVSQYGESCSKPGGGGGTRWKFANEVTCEGSGQVLCVPRLPPPSEYYWGDCM